MIGRICIGLLSACLTLAFGKVTMADDSARAIKPTLNIASFPFPPILHEDEHGNFSGTMGETVRYICEEAGVICKFHVMPLKRAYSYLNDGTMDALITIDFGQFKDCCLTSEWASPWSAGVYSLKSLPNVPKEESDMKGINLIVVQGMKSPYLFMPNLEQMEKANEIVLHEASDIHTAVRMFMHSRAPYMWGSDEYEWHFGHLAPDFPRHFTPLITKQVVLWSRKEKSRIVERLNTAFRKLRSSGQLDGRGLLIHSLMKTRYKEAPYHGN